MPVSAECASARNFWRLGPKGAADHSEVDGHHAVVERLVEEAADRLANIGLRYTNMHTTALCSPARACMLTGRNHHSNGLAAITEFATGYPGYDGRMPFENGMLSEILLENGYNTFCTGKWHLNP